MFSWRNNKKNILFLHENICCGYSLEAPQQGASNEYPQHMFLWRNKKNINTFGLKKAPELVLCVQILHMGKVSSGSLIPTSGVILEGDLGEKVSLSWLISPYLELWEK